ncbi:MAG: hypothetical protein CMJ18_17835 [Phycisphaeraceae bacterium]|nr:hypothetical protein [Phycisphaeraceae bacterium]
MNGVLAGSTCSQTRLWILMTSALVAFGGTCYADDYRQKVMDLNPIAYWRLGEASGSTATDEMGLVDGTHRNGVTLGETGAVSSNTAADYDGSNDYTEIPHDNAFLLDNGSIQFWFNASTVSSRRGLFTKDSTDYDTGGHVTIYIDGSKVKVRLQSTSTSKYVESATISSNTWYHVAFTFGSNGMKLYLNGAEVDSDSYTGGLGTTSGGTGNYEPTSIGSNCWGSGNLVVTPLQNYYSGIIDEVVVFDYALSAAEVASLADPGWLFTNTSLATGFDLQTGTGTEASGLHWADLDGDGDLDAIITGSVASKLLISVNEGASFTSSTISGMNGRQGGLVDIDNDDDIDFWHRDEKLFENDGSGSFSDIGNCGFSEPSNNENVVAADVNRDGWCDIVMFSGNTKNWIGHHQGSAPVSLAGTDDSSYGLNDSGDYGNGDFCSSGDVNDDGYLDFFYHYGSGKLFISNGDGTYNENTNGISVVTGNSDKVGSAWGDYDNDGDLDLFVPRYDSGQRGYLWRNDGGSFVNVTVSAGVDDTSSQRSACWGDYDNDGDLDLYVTTASGSNVLYENQNDGTFVSVSVGADASGAGHDAVFVDYDNDGDLDIAVTQSDASNTLLRNNTDNSDYLKVRVMGSGAGQTNKAAIGIRVDLYDSTGATFLARRDIGVARGFGGTEPLWAHFGGITNTSTYVVKVHFVLGVKSVSIVPSTTSTTIGSTTIQQMLTVTEWGTTVGNLLLVVADPASLTAQETARKSQMETWGYVVTAIAASDTQANFDTAIGTNNVAYVPASISATLLGSKLASTHIGVVIEQADSFDEFGIAAAAVNTQLDTQIDVLNYSHYITQPFSAGNLAICSNAQLLNRVEDGVASGGQILAQWPSTTHAALIAVDPGARLITSDRATGRRVFLPVGNSSMDWAELTPDGLSIVERSLTWARGVVAYWKLDETSGTTAADAMGDYDATLNNMDPANDWVSGRIDGGLDFDGSNDTAATSVNFPPPPEGTIALWMKVPEPPVAHGRIWGVDDHYEIRHVTTGTTEGVDYGLVFDVAMSGDNNDFVTTVPIDVADRWYHIVAVYDTVNDTYKVYIDGNLDKSGTASLEVPSENILTIGNRTGASEYYKGIVDDLRFMSVQMEADEVRALYNQKTIRLIQWEETDPN